MTDFTFEGEYADIPENSQTGLYYYVTEGRRPGGFLEAVLRGDLYEAVGRADSESRAQLVNIVLWIERKTPLGTHGNKARVEEWIGHKGLRGVL